MNIDLSQLSTAQVYATLTQTVIPRPVAWVLSENEAGSYNVAPFSYFNAMASNPPLIVISVGKKESGEEKDTRANIKARPEFVVHIAHREQAWAMTQTAASLPNGQSELDGLGLNLVDMEGSKLPRISDCRIAFACTMAEFKTVKTQEIIFAEISHIYLDDTVVGQDEKGRMKVLADKVDPIGRLGGGEYVSFGDIISVPRPK